VDDVDGDGLDDILVGSRYSSAVASRGGGAFLILGPLSGERGLTEGDAFFGWDLVNGYAGDAVAIGDFDADGHGDVVISCVEAEGWGDGAGTVWIVNGPVTGTLPLADASTILRGGRDANAGESLEVADFNGDGQADLAIGSHYEGLTWIARGPLSGSYDLLAAYAVLTGEEVGDQAGMALASGDADGDGFPDLFLSAKMESSVIEDAGAVCLLRGGPGF